MISNHFQGLDAQSTSHKSYTDQMPRGDLGQEVGVREGISQRLAGVLWTPSICSLTLGRVQISEKGVL